ncbi:JAB domain-containing protein [Selenomonas ruminantium]|uniref:DNA replication and repair protein RadC n=1 Tax=Selenomonas ruminantium TaxID=971 RepID=A0A1H0NP03_SELRU|nr:DNA repair protein RadC [Selenomonas ruminantium]SDO94492.1 DNA replication and repair protein RadC [Selenomonas ruminantium]
MEKDLHSESDAALLATLLDIPAKNLSCKKISAILSAPLSIKGVGVKKASKLYALKEVVRRIMEEQPIPNPILQSPKDVANYFIPLLIHESKEHFMIAMLSTKHHLIAAPTISIGSLSATIVQPREVFMEALRYPCASIILVHNHPSGDPEPSREDISVTLTRKLVKSGKILDIPVLDHVIIGQNRFCSMKMRGYIR